MTQRGKILVTADGRFDLRKYRWDDHRFSDKLTQKNPINTDQALDISRFLREEITKMKRDTITMSVFEKLLGSKLSEYGLSKLTPIQLDKSIFVENGPVLSGNAKTVLKRRYLKKDSRGRVMETPQKLFRRVARHIAAAEKNYGDGVFAEKME